MIIDDVGSGHGWVHRPPLVGSSVDEGQAAAYGTLKNCALVARSWTYRSHKNLFNRIMFTAGEGEGMHDLALPPAHSLKFVEYLEIDVASQDHLRGPITLYLLNNFSVCPLASLDIKGGNFFLYGRSIILACLGALAEKLFDITFRFCRFDPEPLRDILAAENTSALISFMGCEQNDVDTARTDIDWQPVLCFPDKTLCVMGCDEDPNEKFLVDISVLSVQFGRLDVDFYEDGEYIDATEFLIDANAEKLRILTINIISDIIRTLPPRIQIPSPLADNKPVAPPRTVPALPPPDLANCADLRTLVLNMKGSYSCIVETPSTILATLLDVEPGFLGISKIIVEVEDAKSWFVAEGRGKFADSWRNLDSVLAALAKKSSHWYREALVFVLEVTCRDDAAHRAKKWVPNLLPKFKEKGFLHVHCGEDDPCYLDNAEDEGACMSSAVLKEYPYPNDSDNEAEEGDTTEQGEGNQEGEGAKEGKEGEVDEGEGEGNKGNDEKEGVEEI